MKKVICVLLTAVLVFVLCSCSDSANAVSKTTIDQLEKELQTSHTSLKLSRNEDQSGYNFKGEEDIWGSSTNTYQGTANSDQYIKSVRFEYDGIDTEMLKDQNKSSEALKALSGDFGDYTSSEINVAICCVDAGTLFNVFSEEADEAPGESVESFIFGVYQFFSNGKTYSIGKWELKFEITGEKEAAIVATYQS